MAEIWTVRLKALFESSGLTIRDVARLSDIPKSACQRYFTGETEKIPLDRIKALSKVFGVTPEYIMGLDKDERTFTDREKELLDVFSRVPDQYKDFVLGTVESAIKNLK